MKVLLVRPPRMKQAITLGEFMYSEPIGLEMIYAMLEERHEVEILDLMSEEEYLEDKLSSFHPEIVGITTLCIDVPAVIDLAERVKQINREIITIIGGTQTYLNSEAFFTDAVDHVMKYTTRENVEKLFSYLENKENPPLLDGICSRSNNFQSTGVCGINEYIHPNRASTAKYRSQYSYFGYKPAAIMGTAQGCAKTCRFCLRWRIEGHIEKYFSLDFVREEIRSIQEDTIMVFDNDLLHNGERIEALCDFLEGEKIHKNFICYASVNSILKNQAAIRRFKGLGLKAVMVGYETFKQEELEAYEKKSSIEDNLKASKFMKEIGLDVWASFMLHPDWSAEDFKGLRKYLKALQPEISTFSPLTPFPNLPLYEAYKERLLVRKEDYESWSFGQVIIRPSKMSLQRYYYEMLKTNLYVNLFQNNAGYMIRKFGFMTVFRLGRGSIKLLGRYTKLMMQ